MIIIKLRDKDTQKK